MDDESRFVYTVSGMDEVEVQQDIVYKETDGVTLHADVYRPPNSRKSHLPAAIFIHGDGPPERVKHSKDSAQYVGWGRLAAASGFVAVTANHRSSESWSKLTEAAGDVDALLVYVRKNAEVLGIDAARLGLWIGSAGPPLALPQLLRDVPKSIRCLVVYYGIMDLQTVQHHTGWAVAEEALHAFSPLHSLRQSEGRIAPMLLVRAGLDHIPGLNKSLDKFVAEALSQNAPIEVLNYATGQHGFDVRDDNLQTRDIVERTILYIRQHLRKSDEV